MIDQRQKFIKLRAIKSYIQKKMRKVRHCSVLINQLDMESKKHIPDIPDGWPMVGTKPTIRLSYNFQQYIIVQFDFQHKIS